MTRFFACALGLLFVLSSAGCNIRQTADFEVSVSNRTPNTITFYANGMEKGVVAAGRPAAFVVELTTINNGGYSTTGATATAVATFTARDAVTGKLSREKRLTLTQDRPQNIEFTSADF